MKLIDYLLVSLLTLISPLLHGYYFGFVDHQHYLPYLNKLLNPALYPNDYYFSQLHQLYSLFNLVIVGFTKLTGLNLAWTHWWFYLLTVWLLYFAIYRLALIIYKKRPVAVLVLLLFLQPKWAAQIGYFTHQFYFVNRDLSLAISLLALGLILQRKMVSSLVWLVLAAVINVTIPVPVGLLWLTLWLNQRQLLPSVVWFGSGNQQWLATMQKRGTYSFPHLWNWTGWGNLSLFLSLLGISLLVLKQKLFGNHRQLMARFLKICTALFLFHFFISAFIPIPQLIQLQLLRSLNYIFLIALISFAAASTYLFSMKSRLIKILTLLAVGGVYFWGDHLTGWHFLAIGLLVVYWLLFRPRLLSHPSHNRWLMAIFVAIVPLHLFYKLIILKPQVFWPYYWHYPNPVVDVTGFSDWLAVQQWAKDNTARQAVFLTPPQLAGFRSFSERSIIGDAKDGGLVFYSPQYASNWQQRMGQLKNYRQFDEQDFLDLSQKYFFDYLIVTAEHQPLNFPLVYQNLSFKVYQL